MLKGEYHAPTPPSPDSPPCISASASPGLKALKLPRLGEQTKRLSSGFAEFEKLLSDGGSHMKEKVKKALQIVEDQRLETVNDTTWTGKSLSPSSAPSPLSGHYTDVNSEKVPPLVLKISSEDENKEFADFVNKKSFYALSERLSKHMAINTEGKSDSEGGSEGNDALGLESKYTTSHNSFMHQHLKSGADGSIYAPPSHPSPIGMSSSLDLGLCNELLPKQKSPSTQNHSKDKAVTLNKMSLGHEKTKLSGQTALASRFRTPHTQPPCPLPENNSDDEIAADICVQKKKIKRRGRSRRNLEPRKNCRRSISGLKGSLKSQPADRVSLHLNENDREISWDELIGPYISNRKK